VGLFFRALLLACACTFLGAGVSIVSHGPTCQHVNIDHSGPHQFIYGCYTDAQFAQTHSHLTGLNMSEGSAASLGISIGVEK